MSLVEDKDEAIALNEDPAKRLKFLSDLKQNKQIKEKPTAFTRRQKAEPTPSNDAGETQVDKLLKRLSSVTHGPSGRAPVGTAPSQSSQPRTDPRLR